MASCEELFAILGVVFPNRIRAVLVDGRLTALAGPYSHDILEKIGSKISAICPADKGPDWPGLEAVYSARQLIRLPPHPDIVVRFVHFSHPADRPAEVLALAAGPADAAHLVPQSPARSMPLSKRAMQLSLDLAAGKTLQEIAARDGLSINTVRNHIKNAMRQTSTHSQAQLAAIVRDWLF